ncbi:MAG: hypothetical protein II891_06915 [Bacteroidales bacterium]|nr:hypothetical protein [Bacteroidales bacterium]
MTIDARIAYGIAILSTEWKLYRIDLYEYCRANGSERWQEREFGEHMWREYINVSEPITTRILSLDNENLELLIRFVDEYVVSGLADRIIEF